MSQKLRQNEPEASVRYLDLKKMSFFNSVGYLYCHPLWMMSWVLRIVIPRETGKSWTASIRISDEELRNRNQDEATATQLQCIILNIVTWDFPSDIYKTVIFSFNCVMKALSIMIIHLNQTPHCVWERPATCVLRSQRKHAQCVLFARGLPRLLTFTSRASERDEVRVFEKGG